LAILKTKRRVPQLNAGVRGHDPRSAQLQFRVQGVVEVLRGVDALPAKINALPSRGKREMDGFFAQGQVGRRGFYKGRRSFCLSGAFKALIAKP